jgi:pSer/pThr/pTyr-binding forkhead associated (FHA) protein
MTESLELWVWNIRQQGGKPDQRIPLPVGARLVVGRSPDADVRVPSVHLARRHFEVRRDETGVWVADLGTLSGIWLNGEQVRGPTPVAVADSITHADLEVRIVPVEEESSTP